MHLLIQYVLWNFSNLYTNLYNIQRSTSGFKLPVKCGGSWSTSHKKVTPPVNNAEMRVFRMIFYMGIIKYPIRRLYWSTKTHIPFIADNMSRNRFHDILSILHFNDNLGCVTDKDSPDYDKMLPLITYLHEKFQSSVETETCLAIDEQMVPFKEGILPRFTCPRSHVNGGINFGAKQVFQGTSTTLKSPRKKKQMVHQMMSLTVTVMVKLWCDLATDQKFRAFETKSLLR